jgi:hypothetical protein
MDYPIAPIHSCSGKVEEITMLVFASTVHMAKLFEMCLQVWADPHVSQLMDIAC